MVQPIPSFYHFTFWLFNIAMENGPFIDDFPINTSIYKGFSMAMLNIQMVYDFICNATFFDCDFSQANQWSLPFSLGSAGLVAAETAWGGWDAWMDEMIETYREPVNLDTFKW